eukprot:TRINITY_DN489_c0_g1_i1.p1 TRINITY_DN489_c0_g1~~TRINITY_DN489_c0_g1_i1.p1  ORF type:complete len:300 (-),score=109.44 TRINITY_DN489_c0_g1_i1:114-974(-)
MATKSKDDVTIESPFRPDVLKGQVVLITGGASGIGFAISKWLGRHGAKISIMGRRRNVLDQATQILNQEGIEAAGFQGDVRKEEDGAAVVQQTLSLFGKIDILVNCAAGNFLCSAEDLTPKGFRTVMEIDTIGSFIMCKAVLPFFKKAGKGNIINITATLHYGATPLQLHAAAAKSAMDVMTRTLALEWGKFSVRVNGIAPGPIADTEGMSRLRGAASDDLIAEMIPLKRMGRVDDIGVAAVYLASGPSFFQSGDTMVVDGGASLYRKAAIPDEVYEMLKAQKSKL